ERRQLRVREGPALDELRRLPAELAVGARELGLRLELLDSLARLRRRDVRRVLQAVEERLLPASFHGSILLGFPLAAHALDRGAGALVDGAAPVLERRLGPGLPLRLRLGRARVRELPFQLLRGV